MNLVIWGGPVGKKDLAVELPQDTDLLVVSRGVGGGIGSSAFSDLALSYVDQEGHLLRSFLSSTGRDLDAYQKVILAGFSAFHGFANEVLKHDLERVTGLISLDACFSSLDHPAKAGYVLLAERAIRNQAAMVMTSSLGGGQTFTSGADCVWATVQQALVEEEAELTDLVVPDGVPSPTQGGQAGSLFVLDYQEQYIHQEHVWKLAAPILHAYLLPMLSGEIPVPTEPASSHGSGAITGLVMGAVVATAVAFVVTR